jgi:hypothetical protein
MQAHGLSINIYIYILIGSRRMVVRFFLLNHSFGKNFTCDSALLQYLHTFESLACSFFILWLSLFSLTSILKKYLSLSLQLLLNLQWARKVYAAALSRVIFST